MVEGLEQKKLGLQIVLNTPFIWENMVAASYCGKAFFQQQQARFDGKMGLNILGEHLLEATKYRSSSSSRTISLDIHPEPQWIEAYLCVSMAQSPDFIPVE
ncbi:hypothetical protein ILYODFUR_012298 [Ilyodon furcidens]|uniref:Uncharacterized protein n=1 Tax=Ilyodon furcidens TaxID=33524 RepID=A0ABV0V596_9TELE